MSLVVFAVAVLATVSSVNASEPILLGSNPRGPLAMLSNNAEVAEQFVGVVPANVLPCVYDVRGIWLSPDTIRSLLAPLFVDTNNCRPSGTLARAILAAANKPAEAVKVTEAEPPAPAAIQSPQVTVAEFRVGQTVTIQEHGKVARVEAGGNLADIRYLDLDGVHLRALSPGLVEVLFVGKGGQQSRYKISLLPALPGTLSGSGELGNWVWYYTLAWGVGLGIYRLKHRLPLKPAIIYYRFRGWRLNHSRTAI